MQLITQFICAKKEFEHIYFSLHCAVPTNGLIL